MRLKLVKDSEDRKIKEIQEIKEKISKLRKYSISDESSILLQLLDTELTNKINEVIIQSVSEENMEYQV